MDEKKQLLIDAQNLKKYPEFYALKKTMEIFCDECESLKDVDLTETSRLTFNEEVAARLIAAKKVRDMLSSLGLVDKARPRIVDKTFE